MTRRRGLTLPGLAILAAVAAGPAAAAEVGEPAIGRTLAQTWCSSCHAVEGRARRSGDTAPPFAVLLSGRNSADEPRLRSWLHDPHPPMQGLSLSRQQTEDIVAWLRSLASQ